MKNIFLTKVISILCLFFILQLGIGIFIFYNASLGQTKDFLLKVNKRVQEDITYANGKWDTSAYNADPQAPGTYPLYILTGDGFVIERWKPIHGFLDVSDFKHLLSFQVSQTIHTVTNQDWRIYSRPVVDGKKTIGVITVSYFNPQEQLLSQIDQKLTDTAELIASKISVNKDTLETFRLDIRQMPYDVAFQVVDSFNRIIAKNNNNNSIDRIPNFIDASYVATELQTSRVKQVEDFQTKEKFLLVSSPLVDKSGSTVGIIVSGRSISYLGGLLKMFAVADGLAGFLLILLASLLVKKFADSFQDNIKKRPHMLNGFQTMSFNKKESALYIDKFKIAIPYATNQYYLCAAVFSNPKKRWEVDELLEKFGENKKESNSRKVYDTMLILNKKVSSVIDTKLILFSSKTYFLNPKLLLKVA